MSDEKKPGKTPSDPRREVILTENLPQWQVDEIVEGLKNTKAPPELDELMDDAPRREGEGR